MPRQLAGRGVQGDDAVGEQIVARPRLAVIDGRRVADAPVDEIELGIEASGDPRGAAAGFPRIVLPGVVTELARSGNGVETPAQLTGLRIVRGQETADAELAAGDADEHRIAHDQRRAGDREAVARSGDLGLPLNFARVRIEGDQPGVQGAEEQPVAKNGEASVHTAATDREFLGQAAHVPPDLAAGRRLQGDHVARRFADEDRAVGDDRRRLDGVFAPELMGPAQLQPGYVGRRDLAQRGVAPAVKGAGVGEPLVGPAPRRQQGLPADVDGRGPIERAGPAPGPRVERAQKPDQLPAFLDREIETGHGRAGNAVAQDLVQRQVARADFVVRLGQRRGVAARAVVAVTGGTVLVKELLAPRMVLRAVERIDHRGAQTAALCDDLAGDEAAARPRALQLPARPCPLDDLGPGKIGNAARRLSHIKPQAPIELGSHSLLRHGAHGMRGKRPQDLRREQDNRSYRPKNAKQRQNLLGRYV